MNELQISPEDKDLLSVAWFADSKGYAARKELINGRRIWVRIHRVILGRKLGRKLTSSDTCDHLNGDKMDARRENLRLATRAENRRNIHSTRAKSGFFGVYPYGNKKWAARIQRIENGKRLTLWKQIYSTAEQAAKGYNLAAAKFGIITRNNLGA